MVYNNILEAIGNTPIVKLSILQFSRVPLIPPMIIEELIKIKKM